MSKDEVHAKLELLCQRFSEAILTTQKSAEVDAIVAEARSEARQEVGASGPVLRACTFCRDQAIAMRVCGRCRVTHYCSQKCREVDWKRHRADCRENHRAMMEDLVSML